MTSRPINILLIDDDEDDYLIIKDLLFETLHPHPHVEWIGQFEKAQDAIAQAAHDVYLIDYRLGARNGLELLEPLDLLQLPQPFIILTGVGDDSVEHQAMKMGVADYLVKGKFEAELLRRVIEYSLQRKRMEAQRINELLELNRSKDEFIAVTSHQLRTPATAVKQYLNLLLGGYVGELTEEQRSIVERACSSNDRQLKIVDDILRIAKLDLQKVELHTEPVTIQELMDHTLRDTQVAIEARSQRIEYVLPKEKQATVLCDPDFIVMALGNILDNASKYSDADTSIIFKAIVEEGCLRITIADQGVGIGKKDIDKLFKKFSRIENRLSIEVGGTGLGLYWAKGIIALHHGSITVTSKVGTGTIFTITLPLTR